MYEDKMCLSMNVSYKKRWKRLIDKDMMKTVCPEFSGFNQTKQIIALEYLNPIIDLLLRTNNNIIFQNSNGNDIS